MADAMANDAATVLVVDDAPTNVKLLRLVLKDAGYRVLEAASGPEALVTLRRDKPDVMVLDVRMPGMTGYDVCREIRHDAEFATLPVIMVTALSLPEERIKGIEAGATDFITKPFNKKELLARVQLSLALAKSERNSIAPQLPGAIVVLDPAWVILCLSPLAAFLLGIPASGISSLDFTELLDQAEKERVLSAAHPEEFRVVNNASGVSLAARQTVVAGPGGNLLLRVIALSEVRKAAAA
jgi:DNA-binding response OmpR family regulator